MDELMDRWSVQEVRSIVSKLFPICFSNVYKLFMNSLQTLSPDSVIWCKSGIILSSRVIFFLKSILNCAFIFSLLVLVFTYCYILTFIFTLTDDLSSHFCLSISHSYSTTYSFQVLIGNREWMKQNSVTVPKNVNDQMMEQENLGRTAVLAAINGKQALSITELMI